MVTPPLLCYPGPIKRAVAGLKSMKSLKIALAGLCLLGIGVPALAQQTGYEGPEFVKAVHDRDGDKANELLNKVGKGIVDAKDGSGNTALITAIANSDDRFTAFLLNEGADPNLAGAGGDTPLIAAARIGYEDAAEWLIGQGAKIDQANRMGETPLIIAVEQREPHLVKLLLDRGADPDRTDSAAGYSARDYAKRDNRERAILQMIEAHKPAPAGH